MAARSSKNYYLQFIGKETEAPSRDSDWTKVTHLGMAEWRFIPVNTEVRAESRGGGEMEAQDFV